MDARQHGFLVGVLGTDGTTALLKAARRSPAIATALVPRAVLAWVALAGRFGYQGKLPGSDLLVKVERVDGDMFSGEVDTGTDVYTFESRPLLWAAGAICAALQATGGVSGNRLTAADAQRLGKAVDALVKTRAMVDLAKAGQEIPGPAAVPIEQWDKQMPVPPRKATASPKAAPIPEHPIQAPPKPLARIQKPRIPRIPGVRPVLVSKSQAAQRCPACYRPQFRHDEFTGCVCFAALAKSVEVEIAENGYLLSFGPDWDRSTVRILLETMGVQS